MASVAAATIAAEKHEHSLSLMTIRITLFCEPELISRPRLDDFSGWNVGWHATSTSRVSPCRIWRSEIQFEAIKLFPPLRNRQNETRPWARLLTLVAPAANA